MAGSPNNFTFITPTAWSNLIIVSAEIILFWSVIT